jgi:hypothetical protein
METLSSFPSCKTKILYYAVFPHDAAIKEEYYKYSYLMRAKVRIMNNISMGSKKSSRVRKKLTCSKKVITYYPKKGEEKLKNN